MVPRTGLAIDIPEIGDNAVQRQSMNAADDGETVHPVGHARQERHGQMAS
jgi:hypothetical protein